MTEKLLENLRNHPKDTVPILIMRFKKKIEEVFNTKIENEKSIKPQYEKFYTKSLDYRSLRFKNSEKKNNNAKAFIKEIIQRKKDKFLSNNINVLRGGVENAEFYITINLKFFRENISKTLKQLDDYNINKKEDVNSDNDLLNSKKFSQENFEYKKEKDFSDVLMKNISKIE